MLDLERCAESLEWINLSIILLMVRRLDIGLYEAGSLGSNSASFSKGVTWAKLKVLGKVPSEKEMLASCEIKGAKKVAQDLRM